MSNKISIITLHTSTNYGSCLQAYATEKIFASIGWDPEIIDYWRKVNLLSYQVDSICESFMGGRAHKLFRYLPPLDWFFRQIVIKKIKKIDAPFEHFRKRYLKLSEKKYENYLSLKEDFPKADVYCTGSDQVWNSEWNNGFDDAMFLSFVPDEKKKISFSSSIGKSELNSSERKKFHDALLRYDSISLRETSAVKIIQSLGFNDVVQVLDPTLLLKREDWENIAKKVEGVPKQYILVYNLNKNKDFDSFVKKTSKEMNLPVVSICHRPNFKQKHSINFVLPEVTQFLYLFLNADFVITDSFHGTAFSVNFEIPFYSFSPGKYSSRLKDFLKNIELSERYIQSTMSDKNLIFEIDFTLPKLILKQKRVETINYLKTALE